MRKKWQGFLRKAYRAVKKLSEVLVDDASTDGTSDAVRQAYTSSQDFFRRNLFWNGGMRGAFSEAMKDNPDYYLWLNDDTI